MKKVVFKFHANWCGPCQVYKKAFTKVKDKLSSDTLSFQSRNVETLDEVGERLAKQFKVRSIPATVVAEDLGNDQYRELQKTSGALSEEGLETFIKTS